MEEHWDWTNDYILFTRAWTHDTTGRESEDSHILGNMGGKVSVQHLHSVINVYTV